MGFYWDTRDTRDQEQYRLIQEGEVDPGLQKDIETVTMVLKKYPTAPLSGPMYEHYIKAKGGKRERWDKIREKILNQ